MSRQARMCCAAAICCMTLALPATGQCGMTLLTCFSIDTCMLALLLDLGLVAVQYHARDSIVTVHHRA